MRCNWILNNFFCTLKLILKIIPLYLTFLIVPFLTYCQYQELDFENISIEIEGKSFNNNVIAIAQDHIGFLWLATANGLIKYDGYQFKIYNNIPGDSTSLNNDYTESLYVDYTGDLWIGTANGLSRYGSDCDCFYQYPANPKKQTPTGFITTMTEDADNNLWIGMQNGGLFRYNREEDSFTRFLNDPLDPNSLVNNLVRVLLSDRQNRIWIGTGYGKLGNTGGLVRFDPVTKTSKRYLHEPNNNNSLIDNRVSALMEDNEGRVLVGTFQNGLHYYDPIVDEFIRMQYNQKYPERLYPSQGKKVWNIEPFITILHQDKKGGFWIGTCGGGINHFDPESGQVYQYSHDIANPGGIANDKLWSFHEDRSGQLWLGNLSQGGLFKMNPSKGKISRYSEMNSRHVLRMRESPKETGLIWLGMFAQGIYQLDLKTNLIAPFIHDKTEANVRNNNVYDINEDSDGMLWAAYDGRQEDELGFSSQRTNGSLRRYELQTGEVKHYSIPISDEIKSSNTIYRICEDREGFLWLGTGKGGLFRFEKETEIFKHISLPGKNQQSGESEVYLIEEDSKGRIWVGDINGNGALFRYDSEKEVFTSFLEGYKPLCFYEDNMGEFWLGTENKGLLHFNLDKGNFRQYTISDGLPSDIVYGILEGPGGNLWLSTDKGLSKFDPENKRFKSNGLPRHRFSQAVLKSSDNQLFFGGSGILLSFYPDQISGNQIPPEIILSGLRISGEPYNGDKSLYKNSENITLSHNQNDISFEYMALHYSNPSKNQYKYKLEPYDLNWIEAGTQQMVRYTNLDPGEYNFRVIGSNDNNIWNNNGASVNLLIKPAWWSRWWAYLLYISFFSAVAYSFYRFQLSKKLALTEGKRQKEVNEIKNRLYANISHEFRTPLTVILGMTDELESDIANSAIKEAEGSLQMIRRNGLKLLQLVNQMLDLSKLESGAMDLKLQQADMIPYVKYLCESFSSLAESSNLKLTVYSEIDSLWMDFDVQKLSIILTNLLSNAFKFTESGGSIIVHLSQTAQNETAYFYLMVKDNGFGIPENEMQYVFNRFYQVNNSIAHRAGGTGIGLSLAKEYVELMNGIITVKSTEGKGSEFTVQIPITRNADRFWDIILPSDFQIFEIDTIRKDLISSSVTASDLPVALIIEDNQDVAHYLQMCLDREYLTIIAKDGLEGIEKAYQTIPDIIISDVMMPKKDGFEVCACLKSDSRTDHIPIILLTARATIEDRLHGLSEGADAYLPKPFNKEELFIRIDKLISVRKKLIEKIQKEGFYQFLNKKQSRPENLFIQKLMKIIHEGMGNPDFGATTLAENLHLSESQIYRKLKAITGKSTAVFIRSVRLQKAKELIREGINTISEIAYEVGFNDPSWFSRAYKEEFGYSPSETL